MSTEDLRIGCCDPGVIGGVVIGRFVKHGPTTESLRKEQKKGGKEPSASLPSFPLVAPTKIVLIPETRTRPLPAIHPQTLEHGNTNTNTRLLRPRPLVSTHLAIPQEKKKEKKPPNPQRNPLCRPSLSDKKDSPKSVFAEGPLGPSP
jgi:hypothetical protein